MQHSFKPENSERAANVLADGEGNFLQLLTGFPISRSASEECYSSGIDSKMLAYIPLVHSLTLGNVHC